MIRRLKNKQIEKNRWDKIVANYQCPSVYMLSWYLDIVSPGWEALVYGDYQFAMPLPVKRKWKIPYIVQPNYCQKIDILGDGLRLEIAQSFYHTVNNRFRYVNIMVRNILGLEGKRLKMRVNCTLELIGGYTSLEKSFSENSIRNIKKAKKFGLTLKESNTENFIKFCGQWLKGVDQSQVSLLARVVQEAEKRGISNLVAVTGASGETLSAACFLVWGKQVLYLAGASSDLGKTNSSMYMIMGHVIEKYANSGYLLDFEGSNIPGVANFFKGFGAKVSHYYHWRKLFF